MIVWYLIINDLADEVERLGQSGLINKTSTKRKDKNPLLLLLSYHQPVLIRVTFGHGSFLKKGFRS